MQKGPRDQHKQANLKAQRLFHTFPKGPNSEVCKLTKTAPSSVQEPPRWTRRPSSATAEIWWCLTVDHEVLNEENESRLQDRSAVVMQDHYLSLDSKLPNENKTAQGTRQSLQNFSCRQVRNQRFRRKRSP